MRWFALGLLALSVPLAPAGEGKARPTKEAAVKVLQEFNAALEGKDIDKALTFLVIPDKLKDELPKFKEALAKVVGSKEISKKGIAVLAERGKWGKFAEVVGEKEAERRIKPWGVALESCYGLFAGERRGAAFAWDGKRFRIFYFNNIGYLETDPPK
ncbi:MAG: hypothetical protein L0Z62_10635 [Gemmataceae bacterium]|nr:hypothetical protein [Gemmataceae bacterium]